METEQTGVRVTVPGALGRMGSLIVRRVLEDPAFRLVGATERHDHPQIAQDVGQVLTGRPCEVSLENDLRNAVIASQVIIDFTAPEAALWHAELAAKYGKALVLGTTGFTPEQEARLADILAAVPCVRAANFSIGVNLMLRLVERAARTLGDEWDAEIVEAHHRQKQDAPSGTALALAEAVAQGWELSVDDVLQVGRPRGISPRAARSVGVHAVRAGQIVGEHTVLFAGSRETLRIEHRAQGREVFVEGALLAARWLLDQGPGVHTMFEVLELY